MVRTTGEGGARTDHKEQTTDRVKPADRGRGRGQLDLALFATAVIGTSRTPRPSAAFAHLAMRSIATGSAPATPTATPRSHAMVSSRPSARSTSAEVGTWSMTTSALAKARLLAPAIWLARLRCEEPSS